jgi:hypothetical protein
LKVLTSFHGKEPQIGFKAETPIVARNSSIRKNQQKSHARNNSGHGFYIFKEVIR